MTEQPHVYIHQSIEGVARSAAQAFVRLSRQAAAVGAPFRVALSGGSTPKLLYQLLVSGEFRGEVPWDAVDFFFGDERWVPPTDPQSNYKLANDDLFVQLNIDPGSVFPMPTVGLTPEEAAAEYETTICEDFKIGQDAVPQFELIFLGMGDEGHTASLFPQSSVLHETEKLVAAAFVEKLNANRITFTPITLNAAREVILMIGGASKAPALKEVLEGDYNPDEYPAQILRNSLGHVTWLVDKDAASKLEGEYAET
jgi:6-phosphogluconolactonase